MSGVFKSPSILGHSNVYIYNVLWIGPRVGPLITCFSDWRCDFVYICWEKSVFILKELMLYNNNNNNSVYKAALIEKHCERHSGTCKWSASYICVESSEIHTVRDDDCEICHNGLHLTHFLGWLVGGETYIYLRQDRNIGGWETFGFDTVYITELSPTCLLQYSRICILRPLFQQHSISVCV